MGSRSKGPNRESIRYRYKPAMRCASKLARRVIRRRSRQTFGRELERKFGSTPPKTSGRARGKKKKFNWQGLF